MNKVSRRLFIKSMIVLPLTVRCGWTDDLPDDLKVTRIVGFNLENRRSKVAGKNSQREVHGDKATDKMVRIYTNKGFEGLGSCRLGEDALSNLLGMNPFEMYKASDRRITGPLGSQTMPLWDLVGKVLKKPVYELLGGAGPERVPVYDGSIYFADLLPQYAEKPMDRFREEIDSGLNAGHRAFKVKIGRGFKWMPVEEGYNRDCEVLRTIREHAGPEITIGVDANNGYDLQRAKRLLTDFPDFNFAFVEELFPETVEECLELKKFISEHGWKTLVADGESWRGPDDYNPFINANAIDVLQGDMNRFGFEGILAEAGHGRPQGMLVAPHNWGSLMGFYMQLHVGRAITNFYRAENDPLSNDIIIADGYIIRDGLASVTDKPGFGFKVNEEKFEKVEVNFDLEA